MESIAEGKDLSRWRHTTLLYSGSYQPCNKMFQHYYPYQTEKNASEQDHKAAMQHIKGLIGGRKR